MSPRHPVAAPPGRPAGRGRRLAGALVALVALAALLVGIPVALGRFGSWPITGVPTGDQIRDLPSTVVTDEAVIAVVTVLLWAAWALFAASVVVEVIAQVRARARGDVRPARSIAGPVQGAARYLVGTILMSVGPVTGAGGALPVGAATFDPPPAAHAEFDAFWSPTGAEESGVGRVLGVEDPSWEPAAPAAAVEQTVTVGRGDTAWSLAADHLGDGARWREIWEANRTRLQPGGAQWADADQPVQQGWTLVVPGVAAPAAAPPVQALAGAPEVATEVTVQPDDNFWDLAEGQLGDAWGRAPTDAEVVGHWQALVDTNRDSLAPPGDPDLIHPGQVFSVPEPPPDPAVVRGLVSGVAVGEPAPVPDPAPDCDPPDPAPEPAPERAPAPDAGMPAEPPSGEQPGEQPGEAGGTPPPPADPRSDTPEPPAPPEPPGPPDGGETESPAPTGADPDPRPAGADDEGEGGALAPIGLVGGGVAVAGALVLLERRRRAQQRHRRRGRVVPLPPPHLAGGEHRLRWGADIDGARLLDVAVRAAAAGSGATGLPPLRWAETGPGGVLLVLATPAPAPAGFVATGVDRWRTSAGPDELAVVAAHAAAPAPTLVPVGTSDSGTEVLVELETGGVATVRGDTAVAGEFLQALVVAAATSVWSEQVHVVTVGLDPRLEQLPAVISVASLTEALGRAEDHADRTEAALRSLRCPTLAQARAVGAAPEDWDPLVVVAASTPRDMDERRRLAALARRPNGAVGLVVGPGIDDPADGRTFAIGDHGWLTIDGVDEPVRPRRLDGDGIAAIVGLLDHAADRTDAPPGAAAADLDPRRPPPPPAPPAPPDDVERDVALVEPVAPAAPTPPVRLGHLLADVEVMVRVLGEVEAVRLDGAGNERRLVPTRQRALEAIAYLALRESPVDREDLEISLFPTGANAAKTIYNTVSAARALVGDELFPASGSGRYELSASVVTDYGVFCELVATADETEDAAAAADLLSDALGLVRGEPFTGVGRSYAWVGPHRGMIVAQVVDAAEELAEVRLATGDWRGAEWAARQGLRAFPSDERMYRLLMRTARAAGNIPGVQRVFRELCDVLADPEFGVEPEDTVHPETVELLEELTGVRPPRNRLGA